MRPSGRTVPVGYQRLNAIGLARVHALTAGSNKSTSVRPSPPDLSHPPRVMNRPSGRNVWPAHNRSTQGFGTAVNDPLAGSQMLALGPVSQVSTLPVLRRCECTPTAGHCKTVDHSPTTAGSAAAESVTEQTR